MVGPKITQEAAADLLRQAKEQVRTIPTYRLGQALWVLMPGEITYGVSCPEFFYSTDEDFVLKYFYTNFVRG